MDGCPSRAGSKKRSLLRGQSEVCDECLSSIGDSEDNTASVAHYNVDHCLCQLRQIFAGHCDSAGNADYHDVLLSCGTILDQFNNGYVDGYPHCG